MFEKLWKLGKVAIILISLVMLGRWLPELTPNFVDDFFNKGEGGIVIVDSPEVYSRERMINDRFREVAWLEDELKQSATREFGNQAISNHQKTLRTATEIGNTNKKNGDTNVKLEDTPEAKPKESNSGVSVSPGERFRDIRAYREEIRTEMMETLLDDRHDIRGNTLYRLKFDTTVLPQKNTEKLAVIQVKLKRAEFCDSGATADNDQSTDSHHLPCISIRATHDAWLSQTEEKINDAIKGTINDYIDMKLPQHNFAELVRFLQARVPDKKDNKEILPVQNIDIWKNFRKYLGTCENQWRKENPGDKTKLDENDKYKKWESSIRACQTVHVSDFFGGNVNSQDRDRYTQLRKLMLRYHSGHPGKNNQKIYKDFEALHAKFNEDEFDVLRSDLKNQSHKWMSPLFLEQSKAFDFPDLFKKGAPDAGGNNSSNPEKEDDPKRIISRAEEIISDARKIVTEAESIERALLRHAIVGMWIDKYTYSDEVRQNECRKLYNDKLEVFDPKSLSCLAHLEETTCNDVNYCTISVKASSPIEHEQYLSEATVEKDTARLRSQARTAFERLLKIDEVYYSYAITPKERAQRVLTIASESRQKQLALSLIASSGGELDQATISSITRAISDSASQIKQIQRRPLILSFGRGQPISVDDGTDDREPSDKNQPNKRGTDFGWIIGPKYMFSDGDDNKINFYHAPVQNSLSAIISVPSWWTTINLEINTCWIAQDQLTELKETKLMRDNQDEKRNYVIDFCNPAKAQDIHSVDADYLVRLPGSTDELPRKFGYEIERVPAVFDGGAVGNFYVGQKEASLIIQGNELWRSTVVTMGNQKANSIEVLPNMKGIIATFDTIDSPSETIVHEPVGPRRAQGKCFVMSEVVVWTSEGRTNKGQIFARIHANPLLNPEASADGNTQYPKGFGDCTDPPKESRKPDGDQKQGVQNKGPPAEISESQLP